MLRHTIWACLWGIAGLWAQDSRLNIAVGDFDANGLPASDVNILTDRLRGELMDSYDDEVDQMHDAQTRYNIGRIIAGVGVLSFGLTFVF